MKPIRPALVQRGHLLLASIIRSVIRYIKPVYHIFKQMKLKTIGISISTLLYSFVLLTLAGCGSGNKGEVTGVLNREKWYQADPYGMVFIPAGSYTMGPSDQDVPYAVTSQGKT